MLNIIIQYLFPHMYNSYIFKVLIPDILIPPELNCFAIYQTTPRIQCCFCFNKKQRTNHLHAKVGRIFELTEQRKTYCTNKIFEVKQPMCMSTWLGYCQTCASYPTSLKKINFLVENSIPFPWVLCWSEQSAWDQRSNLGRPLFLVY